MTQIRKVPYSMAWEESSVREAPIVLPGSRSPLVTFSSPHGLPPFSLALNIVRERDDWSRLLYSSHLMCAKTERRKEAKQEMNTGG